jgi:hypothetical protein
MAVCYENKECYAETCLKVMKSWYSDIAELLKNKMVVIMEDNSIAAQDFNPLRSLISLNCTG